jgi:hypothetical protein
VADPINKRIQIFDSNGRFLTKWTVPEWGRHHGFEDLGVDAKTGRLYASSANMDSVLMFDLNGKRVGSLTPKPGPTRAAFRARLGQRKNLHSKHGGEPSQHN